MKKLFICPHLMKEYSKHTLRPNEPSCDTDYCESFNRGKGCKEINTCKTYQEALP